MTNNISWLITVLPSIQTLGTADYIITWLQKSKMTKRPLFVLTILRRKYISSSFPLYKFYRLHLRINIEIWETDSGNRQELKIAYLSGHRTNCYVQVGRRKNAKHITSQMKKTPEENKSNGDHLCRHNRKITARSGRPGTHQNSRFCNSRFLTRISHFLTRISHVPYGLL